MITLGMPKKKKKSEAKSSGLGRELWEVTRHCWLFAVFACITVHYWWWQKQRSQDLLKISAEEFALQLSGKHIP